MRIRDVMTHKVLSLKPDQDVQSAIKFFEVHDISGAPVVEKGKVVGVLSEKDIFRALYPSIMEFYNSPELWLEESELEENAKSILKKAVKDFMSKDIICAPPDTPIMQAGSMMLAHRIHRIIVEDGGKLVGIVTRAEIFRNLFKKFSD
ncbi:MAG: CBS domain-containing protein [Patescibacteria group bacterium]|jgi:CBS domain-containing protein